MYNFLGIIISKCLETFCNQLFLAGIIIGLVINSSELNWYVYLLAFLIVIGNIAIYYSEKQKDTVPRKPTQRMLVAGYKAIGKLYPKDKEGHPIGQFIVWEAMYDEYLKEKEDEK